MGHIDTGTLWTTCSLPNFHVYPYGELSIRIDTTSKNPKLILVQNDEPFALCSIETPKHISLLPHEFAINHHHLPLDIFDAIATLGIAASANRAVIFGNRIYPVWSLTTGYR